MNIIEHLNLTITFCHCYIPGYIPKNHNMKNCVIPQDLEMWLSHNTEKLQALCSYIKIIMSPCARIVL